MLSQNAGGASQLHPRFDETSDKRFCKCLVGADLVGIVAHVKVANVWAKHTVRST
jgi:hypothetical protein